MRLSARVITVDRAALLPFETTPAVRTLTWRGVLRGFPAVFKEHQVSTRGGAVNLRPPGNGVAHTLIQEARTAVTLLTDKQALRANVGKLAWREVHDSPPEQGN